MSCLSLTTCVQHQSQSDVSSLQHFPLFGDRQALHLCVLPRREHCHVSSVIVDVPVSASFINTLTVLGLTLRSSSFFSLGRVSRIYSARCTPLCLIFVKTRCASRWTRIGKRIPRRWSPISPGYCVQPSKWWITSAARLTPSQSTVIPTLHLIPAATDSLSFRHQHIAAYFLLPGLRDQAAVPRGGQHGAQRILLPSLFVSGARDPQLLRHLQGYISSLPHSCV